MVVRYIFNIAVVKVANDFWGFIFYIWQGVLIMWTFSFLLDIKFHVVSPII